MKMPGVKTNRGMKLLLLCTMYLQLTHGEGIKCDSLAVPQHGSVEVHGGLSRDTQVGAVAVYSCNVDHVLVGVVNRTCTMDSSWTGAPPTCVAACPPPPPLAKGRMLRTWTSSDPLGTVAVYGCVEGFTTATGRPTISINCGKDRQWGELPVCEVVRCEELKSPDNGLVYLTNETLVGSVAYYNCSHGYQISGNSARTCSGDGQWSGNATLCKSTDTGTTTGTTTGTDTSTTTGTATGTDTSTSTGTDTSTDTSTSTGTDAGGVSTAPRTALTWLYQAVISVICVLTMIVLIMVATIAVLCVKRRKYKTMQMTMDLTTLNDTSLNNPVYEGNQRLSFHLSGSNVNMSQYQIQDSIRGSSESIYEQLSEQGTLRPPPASLPRPSLHYAPSLPPPNLHYEMASLVTPSSLQSVDYLYDVWADSGHHYDTASNYKSSLYDLPASPYEIPTPTSKVSMADIYGSLYNILHDHVTSPSSSPAGSPLKLCRKSQSRSSLDQVFFTESDVYWRPATNSASLYEQLARNRYREILREQIQVTVHLGSGQFGMVNKGLWQSPVGVKEVAIKTLKTTSNEEDKVKFLQEAAINGQFQHPNVVKLYGVVTMGDPVMIVLEILVNGDLRNYLIKLRPEPGELVPSNTPQMLLQFCTDVAAGMVYLSSKAFVHRDLAARNILLTKGKTCKIGDFGLSRDLEDESYYISHGGEIPVKWTAPEALHYKKYSTASDVWSFGCVMYEIWSLGHKPFRGCSNTEAVNLLDRGFRLPPPPGSAREVYQIMIQCWHPATFHRPTFTELYQRVCVDMSPLPQETTPSEAAPHHLTVLGGSLETGKDLYPDLQNLYT
ncbi:tyrosine-protein kinase Fes/Fps-like isoform X4 [Halichondria panicea]|uniref:tyrosine-protein kinase Fes/Fps-like isoform X4 n=1 Tax=Halichondria panicea TaxID=6063 RepID=UPI00312BA1EF